MHCIISKCFTNQGTKLLNFLDDYSLMVSEAKLEASKGKELKILTSKQMLQRLLIALAEVKAGNNWESLLSEIRQIVYFLYQSRGIRWIRFKKRWKKYCFIKSYMWENIKSSYNNNTFKISDPTWNDKFEFSDGSYSASDI